MSNVGNKYKVGIMVLVTFILLVISLIALGMLQYFRPTFDFCTIVTSSVQGLEKGAKVKLKGITIGEVTKVQILDNADSVIIFMNFDPEMFAESYFKKINRDISNPQKRFRDALKNAVDEGLRCQLQYAGITGNLYVQIGLYDKAKYPIDNTIKLPEDIPPYIPSIPSVTIDNIMEEAQKAIIKLGKVDFEKLSVRLGEFLDSSNSLVIDARKDLKDMQVDKTAEKIRFFIDNSTDVVRKTNVLQNEVRQSLANFNNTMISLKSLIDYLEKNPNSVITGKAEKPVVKSE